MANIIEQAEWSPTVFLIDTSTPVRGGTPDFDSNGNPTSGFSNAQAKQLADRTAYLKETLDSTEVDVTGLTGRVTTVETNLTAHIGSRGSAHTNATTTEAGFISATDKTKLDGIATGAQVNAVTSVATKTGAVTLVKGDVGLGNVDNTADTAKPVSTAQQTALNLKANLASPTFTGIPAVPTAAVGTNTTQAASTAFVTAAVTAGGSGTTNLGVTTSSTTLTVTSSTGTSAVLPVATGSLSGVLSASDKAKLDGITAGAQPNAVTSVATRTGAVVLTKTDVGLANVDNTADTAKPVSTAQQTALNLKADLASPALTGTPTAPTATVGTNTTQLATTAFVLANSATASSQNLLHIQDQKPSGTGGGTAAGSGTRDLTTILTNEISGSSLSSNVITLPAGNYYSESFSQFFGGGLTGNYKVQIYNSTDSVVILDGSGVVAGTGGCMIPSFVSGKFSLTTSKTVSLRYLSQNTSTNSLGAPTSRSGVEIYSDLRIWKLS